MPTHTSPTDPSAPFATQPNRTEHFRTLPNAGTLSHPIVFLSARLKPPEGN